jgi:hypothetical protein
LLQRPTSSAAAKVLLRKRAEDATVAGVAAVRARSVGGARLLPRFAARRRKGSSSPSSGGSTAAAAASAAPSAAAQAAASWWRGRDSVIAAAAAACTAAAGLLPRMHSLRVTGQHFDLPSTFGRSHLAPPAIAPSSSIAAAQEARPFRVLCCLCCGASRCERPSGATSTAAVLETRRC